MKKIADILNGVIVLALGLVIAIAGAGAAFDLALGIVLLVDAAIMLAEIGLILGGTKTKILPIAHVIAFALFFVFGLALVANWLSLGGVLLALLVWGIVAVGGALVIIGVWTICKKLLFTGIGEVVVGAAAITLAILAMKVPGMWTAFNIILGVIVAGYGLMLLTIALVKAVAKKQIEEAAE